MLLIAHDHARLCDFLRDSNVFQKSRNLSRSLLNNNNFYCAQHDELESNLKKIPHRNGIWGLEAIVM